MHSMIPKLAEAKAAENRLAERSAGYWLLAAAVVVLLPHLERLPYWLSAVLALLFVWRLLMLRRGWPSPPRLLRWLLALLLAGVIYAQYGTLFGRDAGSALLAGMMALKFLELQRLRDYVISVLLIYFLIFIGFLYSQSLWLVGYLLTVFLLSTATLVRLAVPGSRARFSLRLASVLLLQALPLMLAMHVLFPRLPGSLWGLPEDAFAGLSGLSEEMRPGSIRDLSLSDELAFRAYFTDRPPPPADRYWRTIVMWHTDGRTWNRRGAPRSEQSVSAENEAIRYTLMLEPSNSHWVPALDLPARTPPGLRQLPGFVLEAPVPLRERLSFEMSAHTRYRMESLALSERRAALQPPPVVSARVQALVEQWRRSAASDAELVRLSLRHFSEEQYFYTLEPPLLGNDPVDEFLFNTRQGFCEHYAAAFTTLMRVAGIPARVVTGYQGGEYNPSGNYLIVRQSDAHAWAEVWLGGQGWVRIDPTAAVAPERINFGADSLRRLLARRDQFGQFTLTPLAIALDWLGDSRRELRLAFDTINSGWHRWVLGYGAARQQELLNIFGTGALTPLRLIGYLAIIVALLLGLYMLAASRRVSRLDVVQSAYFDFCRRLARVGLQRAPHEGAADFAARSRARRPDLSVPIQVITDLYVSLRYGGETAGNARSEYLQRVRAFRPSRGA